MRWDDPASDADYMARTRAAVAVLRPWLGQGVYFNMLNVDELDRVVEALGGPEKYTRLGRVKAQYDPENLFRANYNITPVPTGRPAQARRARRPLRVIRRARSARTARTAPRASPA